MKKIFAFLVFLFSIVSVAKAENNSIKGNEINKINKIEYSRQTCTITMAYVVNGELLLVSYTASAGWFLSNDMDAYARACEKALDMAMAEIY